MTSYKIDYHFEALNDADDAYHWYELQKEGLGEEFLDHLYKKIIQIMDNPENYSEKSKKGFRESKIDKFPYQIVYKLIKNKKTIFICSIYHYKRNDMKKYRKK